jgi:hypothetical protein
MAVAADSIASGSIAAPRPLDARLDESMVRGSPGSSRHEAPNDHGRNAQIETLVVFFETGQPHGVAAAESLLVFPQKMLAHATPSRNFSGEPLTCRAFRGAARSR